MGNEREYRTSLIQKPVSLRRLANTIDYSKQTRTYDSDNLYPQRVGALVDASGTGISCVRNLSKYLYGDGFKNEAFRKQILNVETGLKAENLLRLLAYDKAKYNIFALHVNYNLQGKITTIQPLKSKNCRFGIQVDDKTLKTNYIAYSVNWDRYSQDLNYKTLQIEYYHIFNPDPTVIREQIKQAGGIANYKGQIYYCTPEKYVYPTVVYDAVLNDLQFEDEKKIYNLSSILNGFSANYIFKQFGGFETDAKREEQNDLLNNLTGSANAGSVLQVELDPRVVMEGGNVSLLEPIPQVNTDSMYTQTTKDSKEAIIEAFQVPKILIGIYPDGGLINTTNFKEAHDIYNSHTEIFRQELTDQLAPIFDNFYQNLGGDYEILPKLFNVEQPKI